MKERRPEKKKIIASSWHPGGTNAISPVIKKLIEEKRVDVVVVGYQFSEKIFQNCGIGFRTISSYGIKGVSVSSMSQLLQVESPDLVLTGTSSQDDNNRDVIEQTLILAARKSSIKSLAVLDFWADYSSRFSDTYTGERFKFLPDKIAILDQIAKKAMLKEGFNKERLVVTGNPHFDAFPKKAKSFTKSQRESVREKVGLDCEFLLFYAGGTFKKEKKDLGYWDLDDIALIREVLSGLTEKQKERVGLVIGLHPRVPSSDSAEINQYLKRHFREKIRLVKNIPTQELVLASDLTLTGRSTVGVEAVYMEKLCVSLQPGLKGKDLFIVSEKGIVPVGYTVEDCRNELRKVILDDEYREKELPRRASSFKTDGKATERVTKLVYEMLK